MKRKIIFIAMSVSALVFYYLPIERLTPGGPVYEALVMLHLYMRKHVMFCLVPAFFIAGAISVFISKASVIKYFGARANKFLAYSVASVSGVILTVCSCTVLPLFSGIYKRGAGLGPAITFLYSGPAINVMAIVLTARVLGWQLGLARAIGAVVFSVVIGFLMHMIFLKEEHKRKEESPLFVEEEKETRFLGQNGFFFACMAGFLVVANWPKSGPQDSGFSVFMHLYKWYLTIGFLIAVIVMSVKWFTRKELREWWLATLRFCAQIMPLLFVGVFVSGFLLGRPGHNGLIPSWVISSAVGGNSFFSNFFASIVGAFMYFATLTEIPILYGLMGSGMGKGPALALLLAGPALSLPNMLVIRSVIGTKKTICYVSLVVVMATICGMAFGVFVRS